jgi:diacylglycerol kinase (ATP)
MRGNHSLCEVALNALKVAIAFNPKSGSFSQSRLDNLGAAFADAGYAPIFADSYSEDFAHTAADADLICVVGGDGSLRDIISRLGAQEVLPPISVYPAGTINLVAREAGYLRDANLFVQRVSQPSQVRMHHYAILNDAPMLVCASVGPDSMAVASVSENLKRRIGRFAYLAAFGKLLWRWPRCEMRVLADGKAYQCEAAFVLKGRFFAGPWQISQEADLTRPDFQLVLLPKARRRDYLRLILSAIGLNFLRSKSWICIRVAIAEISGDEALPVQVDGDIVACLPIRAIIHPQPVRFA